ncbi:hypothetical protein GGI12_000513 [Dipsacomyces acuminosporus]|nr:hypothetical protein GGI12_000513 [Dipsacomyces acuminosporus]
MPLISSIKNIWAAWQDWAFSKIWIGESRRNDAKVDVYRKTLWPEISGKVLEIGPGYAASLKHLQHKVLADGSSIVDPSVIRSYTALEPNEFLFGGLQRNAESNGFNVEYDRKSIPGCTESNTAEPKKGRCKFTIVRGTLDDPSQIPEHVLANAPYDSILTSFSLCSVKNLEGNISAIFKLLKPGGTYYFIEHVRQPEPNDPSVVDDSGVYARFWGFVQDLLNPLWAIPGHGCNLNRKTGTYIASMKCWRSVDYCHVRPTLDLQSRIMPLAFGKATKPGDKD